MPIPPAALHPANAAGPFPIVPFAELVGTVLAVTLGGFWVATYHAAHGRLPLPWRRQQQTATAPLTVGQHGFYQTIPAGLLETRLKDVASIEEAKRELAEVIHFLRHPDKYRRLGARIPRGFLLHGPPGTGKTLLAKAVSAEADTNFFHTSGAAFVEKYVGVGAGRIRDLFAAARNAQAPAIIFIDEIDALARVRGTDHAEHDQTLNQLLVEMDGFQTAAHPHPVIVMAATNRADALDPAILRPGRFDRQIAVDLPDAAGREKMVSGSRITGHALAGGMPLYKYMANRILTALENLALGLKLSESHSGYRAYSADLLQAIPWQRLSDDFVFDNQILVQAHWARFRIGEMSCPTHYGPESHSIRFRRAVRYGFGVLVAATQYRFAMWGVTSASWLEAPHGRPVRTPGATTPAADVRQDSP